MKKTAKVVALLIVLLMASSTHAVWAIELVDSNLQNRNSVDLSAVNYEHIPLTDSEIKAAWPNLPTAKQVYNERECLIYDLDTQAKEHYQ